MAARQSKEMEEEGKDEEEKKMELAQLQLKMNNMTTEVDYFKKVFTIQKLKKLDEADNKIRNFEYTMEAMKTSLETCAQKSELEDTKNLINLNYATKRTVDCLRQDIEDFVKRSDFSVLEAEQQKQSHHMGRLCTKEELIHRLNTFHSDMNNKLDRRIDKERFTRAMKELDGKLEVVEA